MLLASVGSEKKMGARKGSVEVQKRDAEVMLYLNEMGWAGTDVLCLKFFCETGNDLSDGRLKTTNRRLWQLTKAGFLRSFRLGRSGNFYATTKKGISVLESFFPDIPHLKSIQHISFQRNDHSIRVHFSRLAMEFSGQSLGWRSERRLKMSDIEMQKKTFQGKHQPYLPDGVFKNPAGKKVMFEYENAQKTSKQMDQKIEQIDRLLSHFPSSYEGVFVVTTTKTQAENYRKKLQGKENYQVQEFGELLKEGGIHGIS